jgi:hypothetical protein
MTSRSIITIGFVVLCGAALWGILAQGHQVSELRAEEQRLKSARPTTNDSAADTIASPTPEVPRELLQLRAEVAQLSQEQRGLAGARTENEKLRLQLEERKTNSAARKVAGFIRASEAKWLGYNTPEDTLQSIFWAAQNHNLEKFLEGLTPEAAEDLKSLFKNSDNPDEAAKKFFEQEGFPPGFRITGREQVADGVVALTVQIAHHTGRVVRPNSGEEPGVAIDSSESVRFEQVAGQWKMDKPH